MSQMRRVGIAGLVLAALVSLLAIENRREAAQAEDKPTTGRKLAFLVGINRYKKPEFRNLDFAEQDVDAVAVELKKLGFEVTVLKGSGRQSATATAVNIEKTIQQLVAPLGKDDLMLVMLSGHGQQLKIKKENGETKEEAFYCAVDSVAGRPETQFSLSHLLDDLLAKNVGRKIVLVDACRDKPPDPSRGARGIQGRVISLPEDTAVFFSCRADERSFENEALKHGLFTYCILEGLRGKAALDNELDWASLVSYVGRRMSQPELTRLMPVDVPQIPISAGSIPYTVLARIIPERENTFEGEKAGQLRDIGGMKLVWIPPGHFSMGVSQDAIDSLLRTFPTVKRADFDDVKQVPVTLTKGFWLGQTEVTQAQWNSVMGTQPWAAEKVPSQGDAAANHVNWGMATSFCAVLTTNERNAGHLPKDWQYLLPTEAQWEYACRAGKLTRFSFGDDLSNRGDFGWFSTKDILWSDDVYRVAQKKPNSWGLYDMEGNAGEWCRDYNSKFRAGTDPEKSNEGINALVIRIGTVTYSNRCGPCVPGSWTGFRVGLIQSPN